jgi:hypothetical protein
VREKAASDLAALLKNLSDRMFAEGIRSGDRSAMSLAAAGIERYFAAKGKEPGGSDGEMHLKWAIASLRAGEREVAVNLLLELLGEGRNDEIGERAALLYAETMIAGYERKEQAPEDAEVAAYLLLRDFPSEKAAAVASRAASDFLEMEDYERAAGIAEEIEKCKSAPKSLQMHARLIQAESFYFRGELAAAHHLAETVMENQGTDNSTCLSRSRKPKGRWEPRIGTAPGRCSNRWGGDSWTARRRPCIIWEPCARIDRRAAEMRP